MFTLRAAPRVAETVNEHGPTRRRAALPLSLTAAVAAIAPLAVSTLAAVPAAAATPGLAPGGAGAVFVGGRLFAKPTAPLVWTLTTSAAKCVKVTGSQSAKVTSASPQTAWSIPLAAVWGDGLKSITATAYPDTWTDGSCKGTAIGSQGASYTVDGTAPTATASITPGVTSFGWTHDAVITWTVSETGSGMDAAAVPGPETVTTEGWSTHKVTLVDRVGNTRTAQVTVKNDDTEPKLTTTVSPAASASGWTKGPVTVTYKCSDTGGSGLNVCPPAKTVTAEGAGIVVATSATDKAGNATPSSVTLNVDSTPPSLSGAITTPKDAAGNYTGPIVVHWTCSDAVSGLAGACPADTVLPQNTPQPYAFTAVADKAGNWATASVGARRITLGASMAYIPGQTLTSMYSGFETQIDHKLDAVRMYERWDGAWPNKDELNLRDTGHELMVSIDTKRNDGTAVSWAAIAAAQPGDALYADMMNWANRVKAFASPLRVSMQHEPEVYGGASGTPADFVAAWRKLVSVFRAQGVTNVTWLWNMSAWTFHDVAKVNSFYPGDDTVDEIGADGYNWYTCKGGAAVWSSFSTVFEPARQFALLHPSKGLSMPEFGLADDPLDPYRKGAWLQDAIATIKTPAWGQVRMVSYWSSVDAKFPDCDFRLTSSAPTLPAFATAVSDSVFG